MAMQSFDSATTAHSRSVLLCRLLRILVVFDPISQIQLSNLGHKRIVWIAINHQRREGEQHLRDGQCRAPLVFQDVQTDSAIRIDVAVIDLCCEMELRWLEGVVRRKIDVQKEATTLIWRIRRTHDRGLPIEHVIANRSCGTIRWRVVSKVLELFLEALQSHGDDPNRNKQSW